MSSKVSNQTQSSRPTRETAVDARTSPSKELASLAGIIEKNQGAIRRNWEELERMTRKLEVLDAQTARRNQELKALTALKRPAQKLPAAA